MQKLEKRHPFKTMLALLLAILLAFSPLSLFADGGAEEVELYEYYEYEYEEEKEIVEEQDEDYDEDEYDELEEDADEITEVSFEGEVGITPASLPTPTFHWDFNETLTSVVGGRTATEHTTGGTSFVPLGQNNYAVWMNGSGLNLGTGIINSAAYTISMWVYPTALTNFTSAFFAYNAPNWLSIAPSVAWGPSTAVWVESGLYPRPWYGQYSNRIPINAWSHLTLAVDGTTLIFYINGVEVGRNISHDPFHADMQDIFSSGTTQFFLGHNHWDPSFQGLMDDVRIWNGEALSPQDIADLFALYTPGTPSFPPVGIPPGLHNPPLPPRNAAGARHWPFNNSLNGAISIEHRTGDNSFNTIVADTNIGPAPTFVEDRHGNPTGAVQFNGTGGLFLGHGVIDTAAYSISFWIRPDVLAPSGNFGSVFFGAVGQQSWISIHPASQLRSAPGTFALWSGTDWRDNVSDERLTLGEWQHVVAVVAANGAVTLYRNGQILDMRYTQNLASIFTGLTPGRFYLGLNQFGDPLFHGAISDLMVFNRALTAADVLVLHNPDLYIPGNDPAGTPTLPPLVNGAHHWPFDTDLSGAVAVRTNPNFTGTDTTLAGNILLVPGRDGNAAQFLGNSGIYLGDGIITGTDYTIAFWVNPAMQSNFTSMFFGGVAANPWLNITSRVSWTGNVGAWLRFGGGGNYDWFLPPTVVPTNEWSHIAFVAGGNTTAMYINGLRAFSVNRNMSVFNASSQFFLGVNPWDLAFQGLISDLFIFPDTALSASELRQVAGIGTEESQYIMPGANTVYNDPPAPVFAEVTVHDPSLTRGRTSDGYWYVIGTFLGAARSQDLMSWQSINYGVGYPRPGNPDNMSFFPVNNPNPAVETMAVQIARADAANTPGGIVNFWANEIIQMPCGRYFMYYSLSAGFHAGVTQANRSGIGVAIADSMAGPWITQGMFVGSGRANPGPTSEHPGMSQDGSIQFNGNIHPNAIDPSPFFDSEGNFWLVYASWSGGIFLYEMCPNTGLPYPGSDINIENYGYGRLLVASTHHGIEGAHIIYSQNSNMYYLFVTTGGLGANDGYNVRIFRSEYPDGPFADARFGQVNVQHDRLSSANNNFVDVDGSRFSFHDMGVKILGGYHFVGTSEESSIGTGYLSPGHGGAVWCDEVGSYLKVFHTRFVGRGEWHQIRVHQMFMTEQGWFALAPFRFDGGQGAREFTTLSLVGDYKILNHGRYVDRTANLSDVYRFNSDGTITNNGIEVGSWALRGDNIADIVLHNVNYNGVFLRQFDHNNGVWVQTFTAVSHNSGHANNGLTIWGAGVAAGMPYVPSQDNAITLTPATLSVRNTVLSATSTVGGLAMGEITLTHSLPQGVTITVEGNEIIVSGTRPAEGQAAITGEFLVTVTREGVSTILRVNLNLTPPAPPSEDTETTGGGTPTQNITIPVNDGEVSITVRIQDDRATLNLNTNIVNQIIDTLGEDRTASFDLSELEITSVLVPRQPVRQFADAEVGIELVLPQGTIKFDANAAYSLGQQARNNNIVVSITELEVGHEVSVTVGTQSITEFDGYVTISLPYDGELPVAVWRMDEDGNLHLLDVDVHFDEETGLVTFVTDTLGTFVLAQGSEPPSGGQVTFTAGDINVVHDGEEIEAVIAPFVDPATDRLMVPLRTLAQVLGLHVAWDDDARAALLFVGDDVLVLPADEPLQDDLGVPMLVDDRFFVPVRFVMEALRITDIYWDEETQSAHISW